MRSSQMSEEKHAFTPLMIVPLPIGQLSNLGVCFSLQSSVHYHDHRIGREVRYVRYVMYDTLCTVR